MRQMVNSKVPTLETATLQGRARAFFRRIGGNGKIFYAQKCDGCCMAISPVLEDGTVSRIARLIDISLGTSEELEILAQNGKDSLGIKEIKLADD